MINEFRAFLGRPPSFPTTTLPETMRVGLLFGRAGELERRCAIADAMLFPPRGVNAGDLPKSFVVFFDSIGRYAHIARRLRMSAKAEQRLQMDGNGWQP